MAESIKHSAIIGMGEIGKGLLNVLSEQYDVFGIDKYDDPKTKYPNKCFFMNVAIRWTPDFVDIVNNYVDKFDPMLTVIHSSVYPGTTAKIKGKAVHSPVNAKHSFGVEKGLKTYTKFIGYDDNESGKMARDYLGECFFKVKMIDGSRQTELAKLLCLTRYGLYLSIADEMKMYCDYFNCDYNFVVKEWEREYNTGMKFFEPEKLRPIYDPPGGKIGGHCTIQDMQILDGGENEHLSEMVSKTISKYKSI